MISENPYSVMTGNAANRLSLIAESFTRMTGRALVDDAEDIAAGLWHAPHVILAHGTQEDPLFFYGNKTALALFESRAEDFILMPSRLSAEPLQREERMKLLDRVARDGFIDDYAGVRISVTGRRFRIEQATVWNLVDAAGELHGQAATFAHWTRLD